MLELGNVGEVRFDFVALLAIRFPPRTDVPSAALIKTYEGEERPV